MFCWGKVYWLKCENKKCIGLVFWNTVNFVGFSVTHILQGSVATYVRCGGMSTSHCIANFLLILAVKEFLKSVKIWQNYGQNLGASFFLEHGVYCMCVFQWLFTSSGSKSAGPSQVDCFFSRHRQHRRMGEHWTDVDCTAAVFQISLISWHLILYVHCLLSARDNVVNSHSSIYLWNICFAVTCIHGVTDWL